MMKDNRNNEGMYELKDNRNNKGMEELIHEQ